MKKYAFYHSPIGEIRITSENSYITGIHYISSDGNTQTNEDPVLESAKTWLDAYFSGQRPEPQALPIRARGTPFQERVWQQLLKIPYGSSVSYGQIAKTFHSGMAPQAIGAAVGKNPISIVIPCHRVLGSQNQLTGYAGGLDRKIWLLRHEEIPFSDQ